MSPLLSWGPVCWSDPGSPWRPPGPGPLPLEGKEGQPPDVQQGWCHLSVGATRHLVVRPARWQCMSQTPGHCFTKIMNELLR